MAAAGSQADAMAAVEPNATPGAKYPVYDRLLNTLQLMQTQIEERVRPLAQEAVQLEAARLRHQCELEQNALTECLARIDQCISTCTERMNDYEKTYAELARLNQPLVTLGAEPEPMPEPLTIEKLTATLGPRIEKIAR